MPSASSRLAANDERVRRCLIEPVRVVDQAEQRLPFGCLGEQAERRERDQEAVVATPLRQAKRATQRRRLRLRKIVDQAEHGPDDLVQGGEGKLRLRLDAATAEHAHPLGLPARVLEQRRLAHTRVAEEHQHGAPRRPSSIEQLTDTGALQIPPVDHDVRSYAHARTRRDDRRERGGADLR